MTNRDFFVAIVNKGAITDEMVDHATKMLDAIDAKNAKAQAKRVEKAKEDEPMLDATVAYVREHNSALASEIAKALDVSTSKASALARKLVDRGVFTVAEVKIKGGDTRKSYSVPMLDIGD